MITIYELSKSLKGQGIQMSIWTLRRLVGGGLLRPVARDHRGGGRGRMLFAEGSVEAVARLEIGRKITGLSVSQLRALAEDPDRFLAVCRDVAGVLRSGEGACREEVPRSHDGPASPEEEHGCSAP